MKRELEEYIKKNNLFTHTDKLLIAVSGGADSVLLLTLLHELKYQLNIAHCNFKLRGEDADEDEKFVINLAKKINIKYHVIDFDTRSYAKLNKLSIEEAARYLRYDWFEKIRSENNYDYIITGHHLNDKIETFFINLIAGSGIRGLRSIKTKSFKIIRPFLFTTRQAIEEYCHDNNISYRTDQTNFDNNFLRNKLRNEIIPVFNTLNPNFDQTMSRTLDIFKEMETIYNSYIKKTLKKIVRTKENQILIDKNALLNHSAPHSVLYELLNTHGYTPLQIRNIIKKLPDIPSGKVFYSDTFTLLIDRDQLILEKQQKFISEETLEIPKGKQYINTPIKLSFSYLENNNFNITKDNSKAFIDAEMLEYPLKLRKWKEGDYFYPLGMTGKKKLSDFFIDIKLNRLDKEKIYLLLSGEQIVWIIGIRLDNRFKITDKTKKILEVERI